MKGCPYWEGVNGLLEPPLGPAGTDHAWCDNGSARAYNEQLHSICNDAHNAQKSTGRLVPLAVACCHRKAMRFGDR